MEQGARETFRGFAPLDGREWIATATAGTHFRAWAGDDLVATGARAANEPRSSGLIQLLAKRNADTMPCSAGAIGALDDVRFVDPNQR